MSLLYILFIGAVSGWLAGLFVRNPNSSLIQDIIIGVVGSFIGGWVLEKLNISLHIDSPTVNLIVTSVIGAVVLLVVANLVRSSGRK